MLLVFHDDAAREYAYGPAMGLPDPKLGAFTQALYDQAKKEVATHRPEALADHLVLGRSNGVTYAEISELITHVAFYAGWPASMAAARVVLETLGEPAEPK